VNYTRPTNPTSTLAAAASFGGSVFSPTDTIAQNTDTSNLLEEFAIDFIINPKIEGLGTKFQCWTCGDQNSYGDCFVNGYYNECSAAGDARCFIEIRKLNNNIRLSTGCQTVTVRSHIFHYNSYSRIYQQFDTTRNLILRVI